MTEKVRYNHPGDLATWFVQDKVDDIPTWAVNVEDYDPESLEVDKGLRCNHCRFALFKEHGYSAYTIEGVTFSCVIKCHPAGSFDRWYGEDERLKYANECAKYCEGKPMVDRLE